MYANVREAVQVNLAEFDLIVRFHQAAVRRPVELLDDLLYSANKVNFYGYVHYYFSCHRLMTDDMGWPSD